MASQSTKKVGSIGKPNDQHTQAGIETLKNSTELTFWIPMQKM
jgi:hypothetical protein